MPRKRQGKTVREPGAQAAPLIAPAAYQGHRQEQEAAAAPLGGPSGLTGQPQPNIAPNSVFGPTQRPGEPATSGIPYGPGDSGMGVLPDDPDMMLRLMYSITGHPDLLGLIEGG